MNCPPMLISPQIPKTAMSWVTGSNLPFRTSRALDVAPVHTNDRPKNMIYR